MGMQNNFFTLNLHSTEKCICKSSNAMKSLIAYLFICYVALKVCKHWSTCLRPQDEPDMLGCIIPVSLLKINDCLSWLMWIYLLLRFIPSRIMIPQTGSLHRPGRRLSDPYNPPLLFLWHWNTDPRLTISAWHIRGFQFKHRRSPWYNVNSCFQYKPPQLLRSCVD